MKKNQSSLRRIRGAFGVLLACGGFGLLLLSAHSTALAAQLLLVAGGGNQIDGSRASDLKLNGPFGVDFDHSGNMYIVELAGQRVRKIDPTGNASILGGSGQKGSGGDGGPALNAEFNGLHNLAIAPNGDIYLADTWNNKVRRIDGHSGRVSTVAGTGVKGFSGDGGPALEAQFGGIYCVALDPDAASLYLADLDNRRIRAIRLSTGTVTTVAGNGQKGVPVDGTLATESPLVDPRAVAVDADKNIYILERGGHALRFVDRQGRIRTVAGTGEKGNRGDDGPAVKAQLNGPKHLCFDLQGNLIIADTENHTIRKFSPETGWIERVAGTGQRGSTGVGLDPKLAELNQPHGVYVRTDGTLFIADSSNDRVLRINP